MMMITLAFRERLCSLGHESFCDCYKSMFRFLISQQRAQYKHTADWKQNTTVAMQLSGIVRVRVHWWMGNAFVVALVGFTHNNTHSRHKTVHTKHSWLSVDYVFGFEKVTVHLPFFQHSWSGFRSSRERVSCHRSRGEIEGCWQPWFLTSYRVWLCEFAFHYFLNLWIWFMNDNTQHSV